MVIGKRNIRDFAAGGFRPRGKVELWAEEPVMRVIAEGPFNGEAVQALGKAVNDLHQARGSNARFANGSTFAAVCWPRRTR